MLEIKKNENENGIVVELVGSLDSLTSKDFENKIFSIDKTRSVVLDFKELNYMSSAGLRCILILFKQMSDKSNFKIINVKEDVFSVFEMTGFSDLMQIEKI